MSEMNKTKTKAYFELEVVKPKKVKQIIAELNLIQPIAVLIDGKQVSEEQEVQAGQKVIFLPMIAGGSGVPEPKFPFFPEEVELQQQYKLYLARDTKKERQWRFEKRFDGDIVSTVEPFTKRQLFRWYEELILRDSRIQLPQMPHGGSIVEVSSFVFEVRNLKKFNAFAYDRNTFKWNKALTKQEIIQSIDDRITQLQSNEAHLELQKIERVERYSREIEEYNFQLQLIEATVEDYIAQVPLFEKLAKYKLIKEEIQRDRYAIPSTYKPKFDEKTMNFTIYDGHETGSFHITTNLQLFETGFIIFTVDTYGCKLKKGGTKHSQMYYFSLEQERFITAKAKCVQETGAEPLRYFDSFDTKGAVSAVYQKCYICNNPLHYPAFPIKIDENWVYQLRMCCGCFRQFEKGEIAVEQAMEEASVKMGEWEVEQQLRSQLKEEIPEDNVARIRIRGNEVNGN